MDVLGNVVDLFNLKGVLIAMLVFVPLERLLAMHPGQKIFRRGWGNDVVYVFLNGLLIKLGLGFLVMGVMVLAESFVPPAFRETVAVQPLWIQVTEVIVLADLGFYTVHRLFHAIPWLWKIHQIHHSIEELDWLAAARVHPVDQILTKGASLVPVFALGFSDTAIVIFAVLYQWQSMLIHANVRISFGPLRWLLASPEFHHWHHSKDRTVRDKNFAGQLPLLDILLGTLHMPRGQLPSQYGIDEPIPRTYALQLLHPFKRNRIALSIGETNSDSTAEATGGATPTNMTGGPLTH